MLVISNNDKTTRENALLELIRYTVHLTGCSVLIIERQHKNVYSIIINMDVCNNLHNYLDMTNSVFIDVEFALFGEIAMITKWL